MGARGPKSDKEWADAVRKAVHDLRDGDEGDGVVKKVRALNLLARNLVTAALDGDMTAMKEIGDRLDGKPKQAIANDDDEPFRIALIERVIVDPKADGR